MRWLITGGCGFIGRNLVRALAARSNDVIRIVDNLSVGSRDDLAQVARFAEVDARALSQAAAGRNGTPAGRDDAPAGRDDAPAERVELIVGDIGDAELAARAAAGMDVIVHLAANTGVGPSVADPRFDCITNVIGTLNYLEACRSAGVKRFVFASSGAPVGNCEPPIHEELPAHPVSPYGASKLAGEAYCSAYRQSFGVDTVALRFGNCYGRLSTHKGSVVAKFIREAFAGQPWEIYGDGRQTRDFIFVDDIADAIIRSATAESVGGEIFQIATNAETTVLELATLLAQTLKRNGVTPPGIKHGATRIGDVMRNFSDTSKALRMLGWTAQVSLEEGLDQTVRWFLEEGRRPDGGG